MSGALKAQSTVIEEKITDSSRVWQLKVKTSRGYPDRIQGWKKIVRQFSEGRAGLPWEAGEQFVSSGAANSEIKMWLCRGEICLWWRLKQTTATIRARFCVFANRRVTARKENVQLRLPWVEAQVYF